MRVNISRKYKIRAYHLTLGMLLLSLGCSKIPSYQIPTNIKYSEPFTYEYPNTATKKVFFKAQQILIKEIDKINFNHNKSLALLSLTLEEQYFYISSRKIFEDLNKIDSFYLLQRTVVEFQAESRIYIPQYDSLFKFSYCYKYCPARCEISGSGSPRITYQDKLFENIPKDPYLINFFTNGFKKKKSSYKKDNICYIALKFTREKSDLWNVQCLLIPSDFGNKDMLMELKFRFK